MLSALGTLQQVLSLYVRYFWYLVLLALLLDWPTTLMTPRPPTGARMTEAQSWANLGLMVLGLVFSAAKTSAILGLLSDSADRKPWSVMFFAIRRHTVRIIQIYLYIGLFTFFSLIPIVIISTVTHGAHWPHLITIFVLGFFLVLLKYALAYPVVVAQNRSAADALRVSWRMTRGRFVYVLACYGCIVVAHALGNWAAVRFVADHLGTTFFRFSNAAVQSLFDSAWIILAWVMYLRIKEANASATPAVPSAIRVDEFGQPY